MGTLKNRYQLLGVRQEATLQELQQAYRHAALRFHPDTCNEEADAGRFQSVTEAYQVLREIHGQRERVSTRRGFKEHYVKPGGSSADARESSAADPHAVQLSIEELINCVEQSPNRHVRQVALEAIAARRERKGYQFLQWLLKQRSEDSRHAVIQALGQRGLEPAREILIPLAVQSDLQTSVAAIRSLDRICRTNRSRVIKRLRKETRDWQSMFQQSRKRLMTFLLGPPRRTGRLGDMLVLTRKLSREQLELALLLQKRFPLLLGQILRHLEYLSIPEIQQAITLQRSTRWS